MDEDGAFWFGAIAGVLLMAAAIFWVILPTADSNWCRRIRDSDAQVTFAQCLPDSTEVPKQ